MNEMNEMVSGLLPGILVSFPQAIICLFVLFYFQAHVVMDVTRQQSKGYGFVTFPCRRSTEFAMIW